MSVCDRMRCAADSSANRNSMHSESSRSRTASVKAGYRSLIMWSSRICGAAASRRFSAAEFFFCSAFFSFRAKICGSRGCARVRGACVWREVVWGRFAARRAREVAGAAQVHGWGKQNGAGVRCVRRAAAAVRSRRWCTRLGGRVRPLCLALFRILVVFTEIRTVDSKYKVPQRLDVRCACAGTCARVPRAPGVRPASHGPCLV